MWFITQHDCLHRQTFDASNIECSLFRCRVISHLLLLIARKRYILKQHLIYWLCIRNDLCRWQSICYKCVCFACITIRLSKHSHSLSVSQLDMSKVFILRKKNIKKKKFSVFKRQKWIHLKWHKRLTLSRMSRKMNFIFCSLWSFFCIDSMWH